MGGRGRVSSGSALKEPELTVSLHLPGKTGLEEEESPDRHSSRMRHASWVIRD